MVLSVPSKKCTKGCSKKLFFKYISFESINDSKWSKRSRLQISTNNIEHLEVLRVSWNFFLLIFFFTKQSLCNWSAILDIGNIPFSNISIFATYIVTTKKLSFIAICPFHGKRQNETNQETHNFNTNDNTKNAENDRKVFEHSFLDQYITSLLINDVIVWIFAHFNFLSDGVTLRFGNVFTAATEWNVILRRFWIYFQVDILVTRPVCWVVSTAAKHLKLIKISHCSQERIN